METTSTPKYHKVVEFIKNQIRSGQYRVGELLPGQRVLAEALSVSRPSVKRAIDVLEKEGFVECNPSIGSIIKKPVTERLLVGYLVEDLQDPFHLELIRELDILLHEVHGALIAVQGTDDSRLYKTGVTHVVKHHALFSKSKPDRVPTVYIGNVGGKVNMVVSDIKAGMRSLYYHLRELGHTRIAYASPFPEKRDVQLVHLLGTAAQERKNIPERLRFFVDPLDHSTSELTVSKILSSSKPPTALICYNDWVAIAVIHAARTLGLEIPGQLSITGYDDLYVSNLLQAPLTTVRFSREETARKILEILLRGDARSTVTEVVDTKLIVRESTQVPR
ncbi:MAG: GntR family transcriptional regulator [Spirochaetaceae bacterium]|nr:MAG: GntR family transcriptional regulator [Spirochaetaceae bacterium]